MKARFHHLLSLLLLLSVLPSGVAQAQPSSNPPPVRRGRGFAADPRVQNRTYVFTNTGETLPYALFVSSKVTKDKPAPLIVALHGLGGTPNTLLRGNALSLAEEGGYIMVGPMGYNSGGWYGIPAFGGGRGPRRGAPNAPQANNQTTRGQFGRRGGQLPIIGGTLETNQAKVRELSEIDTMNVLAMVRKEFNIDEHRVYLLGHSMGGAGALYLGVKYSTNWAAVGALAPAAFGLRPSMLESIKTMPVIIAQGDADTSVPVAGTRRWADELKQLNMTYEYKEVPGADHGSIISAAMPDIFKFFAAHPKPQSP